jgi:hypothetical protein
VVEEEDGELRQRGAGPQERREEALRKPARQPGERKRRQRTRIRELRGRERRFVSILRHNHYRTVPVLEYFTFLASLFTFDLIDLYISWIGTDIGLSLG